MSVKLIKALEKEILSSIDSYSKEELGTWLSGVRYRRFRGHLSYGDIDFQKLKSLQIVAMASPISEKDSDQDRATFDEGWRLGIDDSFAA